jgi:DNA polymerase III sliding clamp (beta) subunit (PCNA family)
MEFSIGTSELQKIIRMLGVVVKSNSTDFTGRICIKAEEDKLEFIANNGATSLLYTSTDVKINESGIISIAYHKIKSFIVSFKPWDGTCGAKDVYFKSKGKSIKVNVGAIHENGKTIKARLKLADYNSDLIQKPEEYDKTSFVLNSTIFKQALNKVLYAINPVDNFGFSAIQGMNITFDKENICFAATDGRVLSEYKIKNASGYNGNSIILQYNFLMGLKRLMYSETQLFWEIVNNGINVKFDNMVYSGKLIIGYQYPDYKPAFEKYTDHINISKEIIMSSLVPFSDILDPDDNYRLTFEINNKIIKVSNDQAVLEFESDIQNGFDLKVDINGKLLVQTIDAISDDHILVMFSDGDGPLIFDSNTSNGQKALISPLKQR